MNVTTAAPSGPPAPLHVARRVFEENRYYQAALLEAPDLWLWDILVSPVSRDYPFTLEDVASSARPSRLRVVLQGGSDYETAWA